MKKELFRMQSICKRDQLNMTLDDYNLTIYEGDCVCIWNSSRQNDYFSKLLVGAYETDSGNVYIEGEKTELYNEKVAKQSGIVLLNHSVQVFDHLSVEDNIFLFPEKKEEKNQRESFLKKLLEDVSLSVPVSMRASRLSDFQKMLLQLAVALKNNSRLIVINENTLYLKEEHYENLRQILQNLMQERGISFAVVSSNSERFLSIAKAVQYVHRGTDLMKWSIQEFWLRQKKNVGTEGEYIRLSSGIQIFVSDSHESIYDKAFDCAGRKAWKLGIGCDPLPYGEVYQRNIVYIPDIKKDILFDNMTLEDNISVNLSRKIGYFPGIVNRRMHSYLVKDLHNTVQIIEDQKSVKTLTLLQKKIIAIKRWCVINPDFLFIDDIFSELTIEESKMMLSYLETEQKNGVNIVLFLNAQEVNSLISEMELSDTA